MLQVVICSSNHKIEAVINLDAHRNEYASVRVLYTKATVIEQRSPSTKRVRQRLGVCMKTNSTSPVTLTFSSKFTSNNMPRRHGVPHHLSRYGLTSRVCLTIRDYTATKTMTDLCHWVAQQENSGHHSSHDATRRTHRPHPRESFRELTARQTFFCVPRNEATRASGEETQKRKSKLCRDTKV